MSISTVVQAIQNGQCLELHYDGYDRVVEAHAVGYTNDRNEVMRVWQVSGGSSSGQTTGWKLMRLDEATSLRISNQNSEAPRDGYKRGDKQMADIIEEI